MPPGKERHPDVSKAIVEAEGRSNATKLDAELQPTKWKFGCPGFTHA